MIKFNGQKVINVAGQDVLYLSYEIVGGWGSDISTVAQHVITDMEKQNVNIGRQAQREGQEGLFLAAHFLFNEDDVVVHRDDTADGVRSAYIAMLNVRHADYESSPEGIAARKKYDLNIENKTEAARNYLQSIMRISHKYKNAGSTQQPTGIAGHELMKDLYTFFRLVDDIPNTNWDQDIFLESMKRFNYVTSEHVGLPANDFTEASVKRAYIVGQAMHLVEIHGCIHQTLFVLLERYLNTPSFNAGIEYEKRNSGEQKNP